jgi:hypothetical protein
MPLEQDSERLLRGKIPIGCEPFQELSVRQLLARAHVEKPAELPEESPIVADCHDQKSPLSGHSSHRYE